MKARGRLGAGGIVHSSTRSLSSHGLFVINKRLALAGVTQWIESRPANERVAGSIPSQGTCLGCGPGPQ